jgi:hypothetical protein
MISKRKFASAASVIAAIAAVSLLAVTLVLRGGASQDGLSLSTDGDAQSPDVELVLRFPVNGATAAGDIHSLPWDDLMQGSDIVVIGVATAQDEYLRRKVGTGLTAVQAAYTIEVESYLKGSGKDVLNFRKTVAHEFSGDESFSQEPYAYYIDDPNPLTTNVRYILALGFEEGWEWYGTAEPFRFRLDDGLAVAESTLPELQGSLYLAQQFPTRSEEAAVTDVLALVAADEPSTAVAP